MQRRQAASRDGVMGEFIASGVASNIIPFRRLAKSRPAAPVERHEGRIVFFTGVRYERMVEPAAAGSDGPHSDDGASATRRKRRRA